MRYNVVLVQPQGYVHSAALWDVCRLLHYSLESLQVPVTVKTNELEAQAVNIVVGYHLVAGPEQFGKARVIVYQLEQLSDEGGWYTPQRHEVLRRADEIWDYSPENVAFMRGKGLTNVKLLPLGFHEKLRTIHEAAKDLDVLFYGSANERRAHILKRLSVLCRLQIVQGYGPQRDALIARARIVLNLHFYPAQIFEQVRVSYLLNNGCFVVSESSPFNPYEGMMVTAAYDDIPAACVRYLSDEAGRQQIARLGFERFSRRPMTEYVRAVLAGV